MTYNFSIYDLAVSVVAFETSEHLIERALRSVSGSTLRIRSRVIDNSPNNVLEQVVRSCGAEYDWNGENVGFGTAHNRAIRGMMGSAKYHLILNPDVYFDGGVLEQLIAHLDTNPAIGLIMPRVLYPDGSDQHLCKLLPTPADLLLRRVLPTRLQGALRTRTERYELRNADLTQTRSVPVLSGCFMLLRTEVFRTVGIFDDRFFMYMEDVDFCRRIHRSFNVVYYPHVSVFHEWAKGSYKHWKLTKHHIQSAYRYFNKWGWFQDPERRRINEEALRQIRVNVISEARSEIEAETAAWS